MSDKKQPSYPFAGGPSGAPSKARASPLNPSYPSSPVSTVPSPVVSRGAYGQANMRSPTSAHLSPILTPPTRNFSSTSLNSATTVAPSISDKFSLSADPSAWGTELTPGHPEPDDYLHNPDPRRDRKNDSGGTVFTTRGIANLGFLLLLGLGLVTLFAGYPLISHFISMKPSTLGGYNLGGINASGQVPVMSNHFALVDPDTPSSALYFNTYKDGSKWDLVFSDEFNTPNRSFYPGDDPYWEAVDLNYWQTVDLEWYDPAAVTTNADGHLLITLSKMQTHNLSYQGGHLSSWNKFCFTGGYIEVNVSLPGDPRNVGLWPAIWLMGNLGRAGYGASLEGMWPYSYDSCDWGTLPNQTFNGQPAITQTVGDPYHNNALSYLPGQRLSSCTCPGEAHPGPKRSDGTFVGRSAPELDIFEATVSDGLHGAGIGQVSQSCQTAPFDDHYAWKNSTSDAHVYDPTVTELNSYRGAITQEAVSALSNTSQTAYEVSGGFAIYGVEYQTGPNGYITWINNGKAAWTMYPSALAPNSNVNISQRLIPAEPLYIIMNLGISYSFGKISDLLTFPTSMAVDYVRVYQDPNSRNIGCSPDDFPTEDYINTYTEAYTNPNLTTWQGTTAGGYNQPFPKNRLIDQC